MIYVLEIMQLIKIYVGGVQVLCGIDLYVEVGDFYVLFGFNGVGKFIIIGIISLLVNKIFGKVIVFGYDID